MDILEDYRASKVREGRGFPLDEAARLLADGVYLPDYPAELVAAAWQLNYEGAVRDASDAVRLAHLHDDELSAADERRLTELAEKYHPSLPAGGR